MEEEARTLLKAALAEETAVPGNLAAAIRARFEPFGGVALRLPRREAIREPPRPPR
jgi:plasmid stability protein